MKKENKNKKKSKKDYLDTDFINKNFDILIESMYKFGINTPNRIKHFLAQCYHETGGFKHFKENLNYSAEALCNNFHNHFNESNVNEYARNPEKIANKIYGGRFGNKAPDDGYKYRGRGLIQITFRSNYSKIAKKIGVNIVKNPDLVSEDPEIAIKSACAFFEWKNLNYLADLDDIETISIKIQGSSSSIEERINAFNKIKNSPKIQQICDKMEIYTKNKNNSSTSNPVLGEDKVLKGNCIANKNEDSKNNNNNKLKSSKNNKKENTSSLLFPLDNRDLYIKKLKETIKNNKEKNDNSDCSSSSSSFLFELDIKDNLFENELKRKKKKKKRKKEGEKEKEKEKEK